MIYTIYDNGGKTFDRYTLRVKWAEFPDTEMWGFSNNPFHPQGFGQYEGESPKLRSYKHLGKCITLEDLPQQAQKFVRTIISPKSVK